MNTMTSTTPLHEYVVVSLGLDPIPLVVVDQVVGALERAGHIETAEAFLDAVEHCVTKQDVLALAHRTVTVL